MSIEPDSVIGLIFPNFPSPYIVMPVMVLILLGAYVGTLAFFFQTRKGLAPSANGLIYRGAGIRSLTGLPPAWFTDCRPQMLPVSP
jgi:hypothetical protein